ncbi:MAG: methyltransferase domain-containing protein [Archangium sp.]|nr:methyltransferase domain-containing protein [Archangium sp.]MDP3576159.1 methyltransferase domain-containing protein [Archangium sp.]
MATTADGWAPEVYARFAADRAAPFDDLLRLLTPARRGTLLDLGCGTGELTAKAHVALQVSSSLGLDASPSMLKNAAPAPGVVLEQCDITTSLPPRQFDRVVSNSAFNWIADHRTYLPRVLALVAPGGELAVQMPSNTDTPFFRCALEAAAALAPELGGFSYRSPVESPEVYAELFARDARIAQSKVGTWYYPQLHQSVDGLVEFAKGGQLSAYRARLQPADFERFCSSYRQALQRELGEGPVFFAFRRVFLFARLKALA